MLFNSYEFLFVFLPITLVVFFLLGARGATVAASAWLAAASIGFYAYWNWHHVPIVLGSITVNYLNVQRDLCRSFFHPPSIGLRLRQIGHCPRY